MRHINNIKALRHAIVRGEHDFKLYLMGGLFSRKTIHFLKDGRFEVVNHIDGSVQALTGKELYTKSSIGKAMRSKAFVAE